MTHALAIYDRDDDTRLYLGPARNANLLEVFTVTSNDGTEIAIHAMPMRRKYERFITGGP